MPNVAVRSMVLNQLLIFKIGITTKLYSWFQNYFIIFIYKTIFLLELIKL